MAYQPPQLRIFQQFSTLPAELVQQFRQLSVGGNAILHRYEESDEKLLINLGDYDPDSENSYGYPDKHVGSVIDTDYVRLVVDNAYLRYFRDNVGVGSTIAPVAGYSNRIRSDTINFKSNTANGVSYPRDASLLANAEIGDGVFVRGTSGGDEFDLWTYIRGFKGDLVAASIGSASAGSANEAAQSAAISVDRVTGPQNCVQLIANGSGYDGRETGDIDEYYTVEVTKGSTSGDFTTARLKVTTASGRDQSSNVQPAADGVYFDIGARGLEIYFTALSGTSCSSQAGLSDVSSDDLIAGMKWRVHVKQDYTIPTATSGGTYTGSADTTYIVEVTKGGDFGDAEITVSTTTGVDNSGPTVVAASNTAVAAGSQGATIKFTGASGLVDGDRFYFSVVSSKEGPMRGLVLGHDLADEILSNSDLDLELFILRGSLEITKNRTGDAPQINWAASQTEFIVEDGVTGFDTRWVDDLGAQQPLDLRKGTLYLHYREWVDDLVETLTFISDTDALAVIPGQLHPDNPIKYAAYASLLNSNGVEVVVAAVADPGSLDSWARIPAILVGRPDIYNITPLSFRRDVLNLFQAHIDSSSGEDFNVYRGGFFCLQAVESKAIVDVASSADTDTVLATVGDDPDTSGTQNTILTITSGNVDLVATQAIEPGDIVRYLYTTDGFGDESYTTFVVEDVINSQKVRLATSLDSPITVPQKVEIWRNLSKDAIADDLSSQYRSFADRRVCVTWPDLINDGTHNVAGYFASAAAGGLASGVDPHKPLTNSVIKGFVSAPRSTDFFKFQQLNTLSQNGGFVFTQDRGTGVYIRDARTTDVTDISHYAESIRRNLDSISYAFAAKLKNYIGRTNITPTTIDLIRADLDAVLEELKSPNANPALGPQVLDSTILELRQHATEKDRLVIRIQLQLPFPLNFIDLTLIV